MATRGTRTGRTQGKMKSPYNNPYSMAGNAGTGYRATGSISAPTAAPPKSSFSGSGSGGGALSQFSMPEAPKGPSLGRQVATVAGTKLASDLASKGAGQLYDAGAKYIADANWFGDGNDTSFASTPALPQSDAADFEFDSGQVAQSFEVSDPGVGIEEIPMAENYGDDVGSFDSYAEPVSTGNEVLDVGAADDGSWMDMFFANGGLIPGHTEGVDGVPIQADGGEVMIPTDVVDQLGPEFFDTLIKAFHKPIPGKPPTRTALSGMHAMPDGSMMQGGTPMANGGAISKMNADDDYPSPLRFGRR